MEGEFRSIRDYEEWTKIVADSDTGAYVMQAFVVHDRTMDRPVTDGHTIKKVVQRLARRKGWNEGLTGVFGPLEGTISPDGKTFDRLKFGDDGGWWLVFPADYLKQVDNRCLEFHVQQDGSELIFLSVQEVALRDGPFPLFLEFGYTVEFTAKDGTLCMYDDAPRHIREFLSS
jgi:hypothetical protein